VLYNTLLAAMHWCGVIQLLFAQQVAGVYTMMKWAGGLVGELVSDE
jgi:hypothetical protein